MPRRKNPQAAKKDWRWYMNTALNIFVALSMVLGTVLLFTGGALPTRSAAPTLVIPSDIPTLAPTSGAPTSATPEPLATPTPGPSPTAKP